MVPRLVSVKAEILRGGSGKPDYRPLWRFGEIVEKFLLYLSGIKGKNN